jgi:hypothetical protein
MKNLGQMMKQAKEMQEKMGEIQARIEETEVIGESGGGMVQVTLNGKGAMRRLRLDPSLVSGDDVEVMEDLIVAAHNDAKTKVEALIQQEMGQLTGGLNLPPGLNLPF